MSTSTRLSFALTAPLLLVLSAAAAQAQSPDQVQAAKCRPCLIAQENCSVNCLGHADKAAIGPCLIGCDNAAAACSCDEPATLSAEEAIARLGLNAGATLADACNSTTPCGSEFGACTNWSGFSNCGDPHCGIGLGCGPCDQWHCQPAGQAMKQDRERYRVCFDAQGTPCTEYQRSSSTISCGCS